MQEVGATAQLRGIGQALFEGSQCLAQGGLEGPLDRHHLAGRLHLGAQGAIGGRELVEWPAGNLYHAVIERRLERRAGLAGDRVRNLVQPTPRRDLCGDPGDGITRRLRCQRRGATHPRVHLDHVVAIRGGIQCELDVAPALDPQRPNDPQRRGAEHLILPVRERLARRDDDAVTGVDPHGVDVLHVANGDTGVIGVPHHLVLDLFPASEGALHQDLADGTRRQSFADHGFELQWASRHPAAGAAQGIGRSHHERKPDRGREFLGVLND